MVSGNRDQHGGNWRIWEEHTVLKFFSSTLWLAVAGIFALLSGCATVPKNSENWPPPRTNLATVQPGDVLQIKFPFWPDLNEEQAIRPDGRIALQHIGEVEVSGRTPEEIRQTLITRYAVVLKNPELNVAVKTYISQQVYVGGEVRDPNMVPIEGGRLTVVDAIFRAGGFLKQSAQLSNVIVIRQRDGKQYVRSLNLNKAFNGKDPDPFLLEPYDVVYVPRTRIDHVDQWVDTYINQLIPDKFVFTFNKDLDNNNRNNANTNSRTFQLNLPTVQK